MERHKLDVLALVTGLVFVGVAVLGLIDTSVLEVADLRWLGPLALVLFGVVLVLTAGSRGREGPTQVQDPGMQVHDAGIAADAATDVDAARDVDVGDDEVAH